MSVVALEMRDGDFHLDYETIAASISTGRAKLLLITKAAPKRMRNQLIFCAEMARCPYMYYRHRVIVIVTSDGSTNHTNCVAFTDASVANHISDLAEIASLVN